MLEIARHIRDDFQKLDGRAVFALIYAGVGLTCIAYLKDPAYLALALARTPFAPVGQRAVDPVDNNLYGLVWWVFVSVLFYFVVPAFFVLFVQKRRLADIGLALTIENGFWKLFVFCIAVMLPLLWALSVTASFSAKYPFLRVYNGDPYWSSTLLIWELVYFVQFFGLEFFFRGFLVHSLKPSVGIYSIFVMTVPYTMIHFQKPMAEAFAAVLAGIFLGWISFRNRSIWLGLALHCAVAFTMDVLALHHKGLLF
jgi:uncharacterized protein